MKKKNQSKNNKRKTNENLVINNKKGNKIQKAKKINNNKIK